MYKITCVAGTRPEAIKMAPLISAMRADERFSVTVLATGQHTDMLRQALSDFDITPDADLNIMRERQSLDHITSAVLTGTGAFLDENPQDMILVHGDTSTTFAAALAAFYRHIPVGHVEAGLRSGNMDLPFPEEANRVLTDRISSLYFAPTEGDAQNLLREGADAGRVFVTGNTVIDALFLTLERAEEPDFIRDIGDGAPLVLMTAHRRESWGEPMERICSAVASLIEKRPDIRVLIPLHKNPAVRSVIRGRLGGLEQVIFTEPLGYREFVCVMNRSTLILTDSGGIQEEASALRKPVLILRTLSERPEAVTHGTGVIVGTDEDVIAGTALRVLGDDEYRDSFAHKAMPFGDGTASRKIMDITGRFLSDRESKVS